MAGLLSRRLVFVTGKGGVGKTTVAAALAHWAVRAGKRAVVCELSGQKHIPTLLANPGGAVADSVSIDAASARNDWLRRELRSGIVASMLGRSRAFQLLTAAAPGLAELLAIGKVWDLVDGGAPARAPYELAIVDGPSTGQALAMLGAPRTYSEVARAGPVHSQSLHIHEFLSDRGRTAVLGVALPEEMPVNETLELETRLGAAGLGLERVVLNALAPQRYSAEEAGRMRALGEDLAPAGRAAVDVALAGDERARDQHREAKRLRSDVAAPLMTLPFVFEPELGPSEAGRLSLLLEAEL